MNIKAYFSDFKTMAYAKLKNDVCYKETIEDFYEEFIRGHLEKLFVAHKSNLLKWCALLEDYANSTLPIFWIRKFESGGGENVNDNRRTSTTILVDSRKDVIAAYAYISNYDAQELYNMILNVDDPSDFASLMMNGEYKFHYDNGSTSTESIITSFQNLAHARTPGVFNAAHLYLAHITDVNGKYHSNPHSFEKGDIVQWNPKASYSGYDFANIFPGDLTKKVRVLECTGNPDSIRAFLKAHFFRFVHPFNYYLVPGLSYEINAIFGKTKTSIGEHSDLTDYVKYRMYVDFIQKDAKLVDYYAKFEDAIQIESSSKLSKSFPAIEGEYKSLGKNKLHVVYGASVGEEGQLLQKLSKKITNVNDLEYLYDTKYEPGDEIVFYDASGTERLPPYTPKNVFSFLDLLKKLSTRQIDPEMNVQIDFRPKKPAPSKVVKTKSTRAKTVSKKTGTRHQYLFDGNTYGIGPLALAVVKKFMQDHPAATFADLQTAFPDKLMDGKYGVVKLEKLVPDKHKGIGAKSYKKYFMNDAITTRTGEVVLVCREWTKKLMPEFIKNADKHGYSIKQI